MFGATPDPADFLHAPPPLRLAVINLRLVGLIVPLALDTFAVAAAMGLQGMTRRQRLRISLLFAAFEGGTPSVGVLLGGPLGRVVGAAADYIAVGILIAFGVFTLFRSEGDEGGRASGMATAHGAALILLGLSVSLDEIAIGFTLGLLHVPVVPVLFAIALQTFIVSQFGFRLGARVSERFREGAERLAGVALILLGIVLLIQRLAH